MNAAVHVELWTSWASLLRSYAAAHGLNASQHALVEVSSAEITMRVGPRWLRFTPTRVESSEGESALFGLGEDGTVSTGGEPPQEMDIAAERFARELLAGA